MRPRSDRRTFGVLLAATLVIVGMLAALVPAADAGQVYTRSTKTDKDPSKRIFVGCPEPDKMQVTGGGAQVFVRGITGEFPPGQRARISIIQVIPARGADPTKPNEQGLEATGYAARAIADSAFKEPWHLTVYVVCTPRAPSPPQ